ncbi:MAG: family cellulose-binding protein [Segetibacter sp.]|nr:family cellulose-binding protein [Segetibacter sp.]
MDITFNTPALLFPAISLVMLAYTNRFIALANLVRTLYAEYLKSEKQSILFGQIKNLRYRLRLIKNMQALGILSFLSCIICMYCIYLDNKTGADILFALSLVFFLWSLVLSLIEIQLSTKALELQLGDMEDLKDPTIVEYIKSKFEKD